MVECLIGGKMNACELKKSCKDKNLAYLAKFKHYGNFCPY